MWLCLPTQISRDLSLAYKLTGRWCSIPIGGGPIRRSSLQKTVTYSILTIRIHSKLGRAFPSLLVTYYTTVRMPRGWPWTVKTRHVDRQGVVEPAFLAAWQACPLRIRITPENASRSLQSGSWRDKLNRKIIKRCGDRRARKTNPLRIPSGVGELARKVWETRDPTPVSCHEHRYISLHSNINNNTQQQQQISR